MNRSPHQLAGDLITSTNPLPTESGKGTPSAPANVSVDSTAGGTALLAANANRLTAVIQNADPANDVFVGKDNSVTSANGIKIAAGGSFVDDSTTTAWRGICSSGKAADVRVLEVS